MIRTLLACIGLFVMLVVAGVVGWDGQCARLADNPVRQVEVCGPAR